MIVVLLALLGLVFGSFVNALVWRLHEQATRAEGPGRRAKGAKKLSSSHSALSSEQLSMWRGRSMCPHCHHELAAKDLIPVFSWLWLRGKCRYCGVKIDDNPLVEACTGVLFVVSYLCWPLSLQGIELFQFIVWLGFVVAFVALAVYDLRWRILPNRIVFPLIGAAVVEVVIVAIVKHDVWFLIDAALGALTISGLFYFLFQISGGAWIGGGDVKLAVVLGLLAGSAIQALLLLFFASVIGTLCSIPLLMKGRKGLKLQVPFGPYLLAGTFVVVLFGQKVIDWYTGLFPHA